MFYMQDIQGWFIVRLLVGQQCCFGDWGCYIVAESVVNGNGCLLGCCNM